MSARPSTSDPLRQAALDTVEDVEGWLARDEAALLMDLAAAVPLRQAVVELGNYRGRSTVVLALGAREGAGAQVWSVDPHMEFTGPRGGRFGRADQAHLYANLARTGVGAWVSVVGLDSRRVAAAWAGPPVGLLFVDGDHRYEAVRADFEAWRPHLAPGARVAFDDCDFADVARLVAERCAAGELSLRARAGKLAVHALRA
jgi:predicted O-methyltransferase YrrM